MSLLSLLTAQAGDWRKVRPNCVLFDRVDPAVRVPVADPHLTGAF